MEPIKKQRDYSMFDVDIHGKRYRTVAGRIKEFWDKVDDANESMPIGGLRASIITKVSTNGSSITVEAITKFGYRKAYGHATEIIGDGLINKDSALENCETSAIGRALGNLGIGLVSAGGVASAEEVEQAIAKQEKRLATQKQKDLIKKLAVEKGRPVPDQAWFDELEISVAKASIEKLISLPSVQNGGVVDYGQE